MHKNKSYKLDKTGNSDAIYLTSKFQIKKRDISYLKRQGKKKNTIRLCLHKNENSNLHCMLLYLAKNNNNSIHSHKVNDEVYILIEGRLRIKVFNNKKKLKEILTLDKKNPVYFMSKKKIHLTESLTNHSIFLEVRRGPLNRKDSKFY